MTATISNIAFYQFVKLEGDFAPRVLRERILIWAREQSLRGSVILAPEGINGFLAGTTRDIAAFWAALTGLEPFRELTYKVSFSERQPFQRLKVKLKPEIIPMRRPEIQPELKTGERIQPKVLKRWLDEGRPVRLLDTRNDYEVTAGTFARAEHFGIKKFQDFAAALERWSEQRRAEVPVVMFCTGGIRCEKATAFALERGFENVYQLDGGILRYFEECGGAHYRGGCFVFDERDVVSPALLPRPAEG